MNQKGFATLEVILMVAVIGILASIAVPRFTDVTTKANTAKVQSDLATLDNAIQMYYMDEGTYPEKGDIDILATKKYINDVVSPPSGSAYVQGGETPQTISSIASSKKYSIGNPGNKSNAKDKDSIRATLGEYVSGDFYK